MNTQYVREFLVFAEELHFSRAAKRLYISRPTLSEHIHALEEELGCLLVSRHQGSASLTAEGRQFIQVGARLLQHVDDIIDEFHAMKEHVLTLRVAQTNLPWLEPLLYRVRHNLQVSHPDKRLEIITIPEPHCSAYSLESGCDITIVSRKRFPEHMASQTFEQNDRFGSLFLKTDNIYFFITQEHRLFHKKSLFASDLNGEIIILPPDLLSAWKRDEVGKRFAQHNAQITLTTLDFSDHFEYFSFDFRDSIGIVPETLIPRFGLDKREDSRLFICEDLPLASDFYVLYSRDLEHSTNGSLFVNELRKSISIKPIQRRD